MPDLPPLPPLGPAPSFAADPERFARTARVARHRRLLRTSVPVAAAAAAVVAVLVGSGGSSTADLNVTRLPTGSPTPWVSASAGDADGPSPSASPAPGARPTEAPRPRPSDAPSEEPRPSSDPATAAPPSGTPSPVRAGTTTWQTAKLDSVAYDPSVPCQAASGDQVYGWCVHPSAPGAVRAGAAAPFVYDVCRTDGQEGRLSFPDGSAELKLTAALGTDTSAQAKYSAQDDPGAHDVVVPGGTCAEWTFDWRAVDSAGEPLPPGRYSGSVRDLAVTLGSSTLSAREGSRTGTFEIDVA